MATLLFSTTSGVPSHAETLALIAEACVRARTLVEPEVVCETTQPEPHLAGEFPLSCWRCHAEVNGELDAD